MQSELTVMTPWDCVFRPPCDVSVGVWRDVAQAGADHPDGSAHDRPVLDVPEAQPSDIPGGESSRGREESAAAGSGGYDCIFFMHPCLKKL